MKIYTKTGDSGETSLFGGSRVAKNDLRIEAYGTIDELNSFIGVARATWPSSPIDAQLQRVQADLFDIGAYLAAPDSDRFKSVPASRIVFFDDLAENVEAARARGLHAIQVKSSTDVAHALDALGI